MDFSVSFGDLQLLRPWWLLALLPLAWQLWRIARGGSAHSPWRAVIDPALQPLLLGESGEGRQREVRPAQRRAALLALGLAWLLAVLALAGPSFERREIPAWRVQSARVLALDLSLSMDATDLPPSRLARARHKLADVLARSGEGQTALLVFAAAPYVLSPLSDDVQTIAGMLPALDSSLPPLQGSRLDQALDAAQRLLRRAATGDGEVLLITDAEPKAADHAAAARLRDAGFRLQVLGVGSAQGAPVPLRGGGLLEDADGAIVMPQLNAAGLRELARNGGGDYATLSADGADLERLLSPPDGSLGAARREDGRSTESWIESGPWLLPPLLLLGLLGLRRGLC